jgi:hypothetical protein
MLKPRECTTLPLSINPSLREPDFLYMKYGQIYAIVYELKPRSVIILKEVKVDII